MSYKIKTPANSGFVYVKTDLVDAILIYIEW